MTRTRTTLQFGLPVVVVGLSVLGARAIVQSRGTPEPVARERTLPLVRTLVARAEPTRLSVRAQGTVEPRTDTTLVSEVAGRVEYLSPALASGGFFEAGDLLLRIDDTDYRMAVEEARAGVARAESRLAQEEADADVAKREWESLGSGAEATPLVLRVPQLAEARAELAAARATLDKAQRDVDRTRLAAPYPGRVRSRAVDIGQFVARSVELARVYAVDYAEVRLPLADKELALLDLPLDRGAAGNGHLMPAVTLTATFAGRESSWPGVVDRVEGAIDPTTRSVVLVARIDDPYGRESALDRPPLFVGIYVDAAIEGRVLESAIALPREALRSRGRVFVMDAENRLSMRDVDVVSADRERVVVASGLNEGERVVISPLELPVDGMELREAEVGRR